MVFSGDRVFCVKYSKDLITVMRTVTLTQKQVTIDRGIQRVYRGIQRYTEGIQRVYVLLHSDLFDINRNFTTLSFNSEFTTLFSRHSDQMIYSTFHKLFSVFCGCDRTHGGTCKCSSHSS